LVNAASFRTGRLKARFKRLVAASRPVGVNDFKTGNTWPGSVCSPAPCADRAANQSSTSKLPRRTNRSWREKAAVTACKIRLGFMTCPVW
jgi:hypothetical protein